MNKIAIYGAGPKGKALLEAIESTGVKVDFFIDQFIDIKELKGKPIFRLNDVEVNETTVIYISVHEYVTSLLKDAFIIRDHLIELGFTKVFDFVQTLHEFPGYLKCMAKYIDGIWLCEDKERMVNKKKIAEFKKLLSEQKSIELLEALVSFRKNLTPETYVLPDQKIQCFPDDIDVHSKIDKLRFVDCGAYNGDTISVILQCWEKPIEYIAAFEPDKTNFEDLEKTIVNSNSNSGFYAAIYPCAVWSTNDILLFKSGKASASSLVDKDTSCEKIVSVPAVSLDKTVFTLKPNYIKMDIEGAEKEALIGAERIIKTFSPVLAICVYHKPEDLWEIPLLIHDIKDDYNMYLRQHQHMCQETVLYCIPKEKCV